jgi:prepilin-type N-terminal cleavage/methylation domain-containing protein
MGKNQGVTLTELMVTVTLIGIIAAIAVPGLHGYSARFKLRQQVDLLVGVITRAHIKAMQDAPWRVLFDPAGRTYYAYCDRNANAHLDAGEEVQGGYRLCEGVSFGSKAQRGPNDTAIPEDGISFQDNRIVFNRMGGCNAGTLYLSSLFESAAIRIMPASGAVYVWLYRGQWVSK